MANSPKQIDLFAPALHEFGPLLIKVNGYDVTDRMPLTRAELERQREIVKADAGAGELSKSK